MVKTKFGVQFGERLKKARERKNISRKDIADRVDVHPNTYGLYERGNRVPDALMIRSICDLLQVNYIWLFTGEGPMTLPNNRTGFETGLLEKIIENVESFLDDKLAVLSPRKKARVIAILYEKAIKDEEWRKKAGLEEADQQFVSLLAEDAHGKENNG